MKWDFLPLISPFHSSNSIQYQLFGYGLKLEYKSALSQKKVSLKKYGEDATPGYNLVNFFVEKEVVLAKKRSLSLFIRIGVTNLFDESYYSHLSVVFLLQTTFTF